MHPAAVRERARALAAAGRSDAEIAAQIHLPRTTVRDIRRTATRPVCPRCWRQAQPMNWGYDDYAFLLGLYLGDGYISRGDRTFRLRLSLDARHPGVIADARRMLERGFCRNRVGLVVADGGSTIVVSVYSSHLPCLLPQHASGVKHRR